jgi:hypothetical protein
MAPPKLFGQTMSKKGRGNNSNYQRQFGGGGGKNATVYRSANQAETTDEETKAQWRRRKQAIGEKLDESFGMERFAWKGSGAVTRRRGWLYNMLPTNVSRYLINNTCIYNNS